MHAGIVVDWGLDHRASRSNAVPSFVCSWEGGGLLECPAEILTLLGLMVVTPPVGRAVVEEENLSA